MNVETLICLKSRECPDSNQTHLELADSVNLDRKTDADKVQHEL